MKNKKRLSIILGSILLTAIIVRFLFFPDNVYFAFDQARDAYSSQEIFQGNLKIVGPPTSGNLFHHGVLYYYIFAPVYEIFNGDPAAVSAFLRIVNSCGILIIFAIGAIIFNPVVGIIAAILFAFSYEQTQFALFLNHPSLAVISVLLFYLGLSIWIFKKERKGLVLSLFGLGLSIQFEFVELQLIAIFIIFVIYFRKYLPSPKEIKFYLICSLAFLIPVSSYLIYELKFNFSTVQNLFYLLPKSGVHKNGYSFIQLITANRFLQDNIIFYYPFSAILGIVLLIIFIKLVMQKNLREKMTFLAFWFFGGFLIYFITSDNAYFYNTGTSLALIIFVAFILYQLGKVKKALAVILLLLIIFSSLYLIFQNNRMGPNQGINPQIGLLYSDEKKVIDYIYQKAGHKEFAVNALTLPLNINTTWSYLFENYGKEKYGYLPVWGGDSAEGYPGNLKVIKARSELPVKRFLIIEPTNSIKPYLVDAFLTNENIFSGVLEKKKIGTIEVWVQEGR